MLRFCSVGVALVLLSSMVVSDAAAQRNAAAKARGDFGTGFWNSGNRNVGRRSYSYQPTRSTAESYRSFSYEPAAFSPGDTVHVRRDGVQMMKGADVVGALENGTQFTVTKVIDGWLGAVIEQDGQTLNGWVWHNNVVSGDQAMSSEPTAAARPESQPETYRRFSYEPSTRSYRGTTQALKPPWAYPKTDPRRYSRSQPIR